MPDWLSVKSLVVAIKNPYPLLALLLVLIILVAGTPWLAFAALLVWLVAFLYLMRRTPRDALAALTGGDAFEPVAAEQKAPLRSKPEDLSDFEIVCFKHLYQRAGTFGAGGQFSAEYFLDLMEAAVLPRRLEILVREMRAHMENTLKHVVPDVGAVAGPKRGNVLLTAAIGHSLGVDVILVKSAPLFGRWLEGLIPHNKNVLLIDDISSDGALLTETANRLREEDLIVSHAAVLVDRVEGDANEALASENITLHAARRFSDSDLAGLVDRGRRAEH